MQATDKRGVTYDISEVRAGLRHEKLRVPTSGTSLILERISDRPVDIKRRGRKNMSRASKRAMRKLLS